MGDRGGEAAGHQAEHEGEQDDGGHRGEVLPERRPGREAAPGYGWITLKRRFAALVSTLPAGVGRFHPDHIALRR